MKLKEELKKTEIKLSDEELEKLENLFISFAMECVGIDETTDRAFRSVDEFHQLARRNQFRSQIRMRIMEVSGALDKMLQEQAILDDAKEHSKK